MRAFRDWPIQEKLTAIMMLTSSTVLLLVSLTFVVNERESLRRTLIERLSTVADLVGTDSAAALTFQDREDAEETLKRLRLESHIIDALIFNKDGRLFASYSTEAAQVDRLSAPLPDLTEGHVFTDDAIVLTKSILREGKIIGWIRIRSDTHEFLARLWSSVEIAAVLILVLGLLSYLLSSIFQRAVSVPILRLVQSMKQVSAEKNYSVRVESGTQDELGSLIAGFNDMLAHIQERDSKLKQYGEELEQQVLERTEELSRLNLALQQSERVLRKQQGRLLDLTKSQAVHNGDLDLALREITEAAAETLEIERVGVWLFTGDRTAIRCVDLYERTQKRHSEGITLAAAQYPTYFQELAYQHIIDAGDARSDARTSEFTQSYLAPLGITSMLDVPIPFGDRVAGVICHEHTGPARQWTLEEQQFCSSMANHVSLALESAERRQAEQALRHTEEETRLIIETALDAVIVMDDTGTIMQWNRQAELTFGWTADEAIGRNLSDTIIPPMYREHHRRGLQRFLATGEASVLNKRIEISAVRRNGTEFPVELAISHFKRGTCHRFTGFIVDISERKRAEEELKKAKEAAEAASRAKSQFLANMSHEIRTPMNGVLGMTELLLASDMTTKQRHFAQTVQKSGESLLAIINDILDFSKIEAGKLTLEPIDFNLRGVVEESAELLAERAHMKNLELACRIPADLPAFVHGDANRLRQILINLIGNALKFTVRGEVVVSVSLVEENADHVRLRFEVRDTGIGIPADAQAHIFESFSQADGSTTRKYGGTGLGLAIVKQLAGMMQGTVGLESELGSGSIFWFTARLGKGTNPGSSGNTRIFQDSYVLIVDDNETNRRILQEQLSGWGIAHASADSGPQALLFLRKAAERGRAYDLVILDMQMPEMDGLSVARIIHQTPALAKTCMVLLTSIGDHLDEHSYRDAGIVASLTKPVRQSQLFNCLASAVAGQIPRVEAGSTTPETSAHAATATLSADRKACILSAEDNPVNQQVATAMLEALGCEVDAVGNGQAALLASSDNAYDVILMDCQMPDMDGFAATRAIREREALANAKEGMLGVRRVPFDVESENFEPRTPNIEPRARRRIPIIAVTAHALAGDREQCLAAGMDDYLAKPFTQGQLSDILSRWFRAGEPAPVKSIPARPVTQSPIDRAALEEIRQLGLKSQSGILKNVITTYLETTPAALELMQRASVASDGETLHQTAHRLKSSSGALGAKQLAALFGDLETIGRSHDLQHASTVLANALAEYDLVREALAEYLVKAVRSR